MAGRAGSVVMAPLLARLAAVQALELVAEQAEAVEEAVSLLLKPCQQVQQEVPLLVDFIQRAASQQASPVL